MIPIRFLGLASIAGNMTDLLSYMEPLYERGYDVKAFLCYGKFTSPPFDELYKLWNSPIPRENFIQIPLQVERVKIDNPQTLVIANAPIWTTNKELNIRLCKIIFKHSEQVPKVDGIKYFSPSLALSKEIGSDFIPRPLNLDFFKNACKKQRKYEITDASVINKRKGLEVLNELSKNYRVRLALVKAQEWQEEFLRDYPEIKAEFNLSRIQLAELFGNSKLIVHPSQSEQACCALDEAMTAGCYPIVKKDASVSYKEQLGPFYNIGTFRTFDELINTIDVLLDLELDHEEISNWAYFTKHRKFNQFYWLEYLQGVANVFENR